MLLTVETMCVHVQVRKRERQLVSVYSVRLSVLEFTERIGQYLLNRNQTL